MTRARLGANDDDPAIPTLVGTFKLPVPLLNVDSPEEIEKITIVGIDSHGQLWGLVATLSGMGFDRWVPYQHLYFADEDGEYINYDGGWFLAEDPPAIPPGEGSE